MRTTQKTRKNTKFPPKKKNLRRWTYVKPTLIQRPVCARYVEKKKDIQTQMLW